MSILKNGYFKVSRNATTGDLYIAIRGANNKTLSATEGIKTWDNVRGNVLAHVRATGGREAIIVNATGQSATGENEYMRLKADATDKRGYKIRVLTSVTDADEKAVEDENAPIVTLTAEPKIEGDSATVTAESHIAGPGNPINIAAKGMGLVAGPDTASGAGPDTF